MYPKIPKTICKDKIIEVKTNNEDLLIGALKLCSRLNKILIIENDKYIYVQSAV